MSQGNKNKRKNLIGNANNIFIDFDEFFQGKEGKENKQGLFYDCSKFPKAKI